jgi:hypothetical protein
MEWESYVARMREIRNAYKIFVGKLEEKSTLGRPKRSWQNNIKMDLKLK